MTTPLRILVTGGTGFIGRALVPGLIASGHQVSLVARTKPSDFVPADSPPTTPRPRPTPLQGYDQGDGRGRGVVGGISAIHLVEDLSQDSVPAEIFSDTDVLVHLASKIRVHDQGDPAQSVSVRMSRIVADRAQAAGVPRVLMLSSVAATVADRDPALARQYGKEKQAADAAFQEILGDKVVYIRPPAVYGPGMSGPLVTLAKLVRKGAPLPLGSARAPRDYISLGNLVALLQAVAGAPAEAWDRAGGQIFMPSDGAPVATDALIRMMAGAMDKPARLLPLPLGLLRGVGRLTGKQDMVSGAIDGLDYADNAPLADIFGWTPHEQMPDSLGFLETSA